MKIRIEVECEPEDVRRLMGLPDVSGMNERLVEALESRLSEAMAGLDPAEAWRTWAATGVGGFERVQEVWTELMRQAGGGAGSGAGGGSGKKGG